MNSEDRKRKKQKADRDAFRMIAMISQFGINMLVPIFLCFFVGLWLDKKLGTSYIMIIAFFIGAAAGFRNIYIFVKKQDEREKNEKLEENASNQSYLEAKKQIEMQIEEAKQIKNKALEDERNR